jgi:ABC-2 type transport system ATP-binding protein
MLQVVAVSKVYAPPTTWLRPFIRAAVRQPVQALRDVSMQVSTGEIVGLVGPNGAGKTTLIKVISTLLEPTSGHVTVDGHETSRSSAQVRQRLGIVLEGDQGLYDRLTGRQNLELYGRLAGLEKSAARRRADALLNLLDLAARDKLVFGFSAGMKMRLSIARAMMADPALLVLDEPTRSLDPLASRSTMRLFRSLADEGRAVLLSNHRLDEVVAVCTRIVAIVNGSVCFTGRPRDLADTPQEIVTALGDLLERKSQETS